MPAAASEADEIRGFYRTRYADVEPRDHEWTSATAAPELVNLVTSGRIPAGAAVLDIGCGVGSESVYLAVQGFQVAAIDIAEQAVERGRALAAVYGARIDWSVGDVLDLPHESGRFDVVVDRGCFHCMRAPERAPFAAEIARVLRPGGLFVLRCLASQRIGAPVPPEASRHVQLFGVSSRTLWRTFDPQFACERLDLDQMPGDPATAPCGWLGLWRRLGDDEAREF